MKKCYYARPISIDNTPQYERDIELIKNLGYELVPTPEEKIKILKSYKIIGMAAFQESVQKSDVLLFRSFLDGKIGSGVAAEIEMAQAIGIPVIEIARHIKQRSLTPIETKEYLAELGQR